MIRLLRHTKDVVFGKDVDYIIYDVKEFVKLRPYLYPKLQGVWNIGLLNFPLDKVYELIKTEKDSPLNIIVYMKAVDLSRVLLRYPKLEYKEPSKWEKYVNYIKTLNINIENTALRELYKRTRGNLDNIATVIDRVNGNTLNMLQLNKIIPKQAEVIYASDVVLTFLIKHNKLIKSKGSRLSQYKYKSYTDLLSKMINTIGRDYAFYAIRKYIANLVKEKERYLKNKIKDEKLIDIMQCIDQYELLRLYIAFLKSTPDMLECTFLICRGGESNVSLYEKAFIT